MDELYFFVCDLPASTEVFVWGMIPDEHYFRLGHWYFDNKLWNGNLQNLQIRTNLRTYRGYSTGICMNLLRARLLPKFTGPKRSYLYMHRMTSMSSASTIVHNSSFLTETSPENNDNRLAVIVLNGIGLGACFSNVWEKAEVTICADGGANKLFDWTESMKVLHQYVPSYIKGDLDSIRPDVRAFYEDKGTTVLHDSDQNTNDLDKCLQLLQEIQANKESVQSKPFTVVILGALGGRFDQEAQNVNILYRWNCFRDIVLLSDHSLVRKLSKGRHEIYPNWNLETRTCGLIPIGTPCSDITTQGLKWNLTNHRMDFGGLVSSSNHIVDESVTVETSDAVIWTTALIGHS